MTARHRRIEAKLAHVSGSPGATPRLAGVARVLWPLFGIALASGYLLRAALPFPPLGLLTCGMLFLLLAGATAYLLADSDERLKAFLKGARGEEVVARELALLPSGYNVFHGVSLPGGRKSEDIDHVVVGRNGIFAIETKSWSGEITLCEGEIRYNDEIPDRPPIEQVRHAAEVLQRAIREKTGLEAVVQPVLCFAEGDVHHGIFGSGGVVICRRGLIRDVITEEPSQELYSGDDTARIVRCLEALVRQI